MNSKIIFSISLVLFMESINAMVTTLNNGEQLQHFEFKTESQSRTEDIKYNNTSNEMSSDSGEQLEQDSTTVRPVEYRGGYSFISADGYEYTVLYKANKNGFQPFVTARKLYNDKV